jgi:hypothetical protein
MINENCGIINIVDLETDIPLTPPINYTLVKILRILLVIIMKS